MSATAPSSATLWTSRHDAATPFHRLVRVELRKSYDTRAGFWLLASIGLIVLAAEVIVARGHRRPGRADGRSATSSRRPRS